VIHTIGYWAALILFLLAFAVGVAAALERPRGDA
jgi:UPF0716 family protein affecting phage T7 exclusion